MVKYLEVNCSVLKGEKHASQETEKICVKEVIKEIRLIQEILNNFYQKDLADEYFKLKESLLIYFLNKKNKR